MVGRRNECDRLRWALDSAIGRESQVLAVEGPPGCGKSALLDHATRSAAGFTLMRCIGVEGEQEVPFGALLELVRPHLDEVAGLPDVSRDALLGALALAPPTMADRLAIGASVLQLIGALAERAPVLVIVDDLQWIDAASREAVMFALRRVRYDRVAALVGVRDDAGVDLRGFEILRVEPLSPSASVELLQMRGRWSAGVASDLARRCKGNPLALIEVGEMLTDRQRRGIEKLPDHLPAGSATIRLFRTQIEGLEGPARFGLLVVALSHEPRQALVEAACRAVGAGLPDWADLERARLIVRHASRLRFTHPVVRSAVIGLADPLSIRRAHQGLAEVVEDPNRRTWHRADASIDADEALAGELERMAFDALMLGDTTASLHAAARAAELSGDAGSAAARSLIAAQSAALAGLDPAEHIRLARAGPPEVRGEALVVEAATAAWSGDTATLRRLLDGDLAGLEVDNRTAAALVCAFAATAAFNEMQLDEAAALSERAWSLADERFDIDHPFGLMPGVAVGIHAPSGAARLDELSECRRLIEERGTVDLATPLAMGLLVVDRHEEALGFAHAMHVKAVRDGRVVAAAWTAIACGMSSYLMGDLPSVVRWCSLGHDLGQAAGVPFVVAQATSQLATVAALRGDRAAVLALTAELDVAPLSDSPAPTMYAAGFASILDELLSGTLEAAVPRLRAFPDLPMQMTEHWPAVYELVEALVRLGRRDEARMLGPTLDALETDHCLSHGGQIERCRGLMAGADTFDAHFLASIELLAAGPRRIELARSRLCYGERLIQAGRGPEASEQLRTALVVFDANGCRPWAERARAGLASAGIGPPAMPMMSVDQLTAQEQQVAHAVVSGMTNREVAAALFVSPKTIETHLTRIYRKLGLRSRTELANAIGGRPIVYSDGR